MDRIGVTMKSKYYFRITYVEGPRPWIVTEGNLPLKDTGKDYIVYLKEVKRIKKLEN